MANNNHDNTNGIQLVGYSHNKGSFFNRNLNQEPTPAAYMDKKDKMDKMDKKSRKKSKKEKSPDKEKEKAEGSKRGKGILSSGRSKMKGYFRKADKSDKLDKQQPSEPKPTPQTFDDSNTPQAQEDQVEAAAVAIGLENAESSSKTNSPIILDPEDIQEFDEEGRRIIHLKLDKNYNARGSKIFQVIKNSVPKITAPLLKRNSVVSLGSGSFKEDDDDKDGPRFPARQYPISYVSEYADEVEYNSEDSDSEYCYSGMLNKDYVEPVRTLTRKGSNAGRSTPGSGVNTSTDGYGGLVNVGHPLSQGHMYPGQGQINTSQGYLNTSQGHLNTSQGHLNTSQGHMNMVQGHPNVGQGFPNMGQGHMNIGQGHADPGQKYATYPYETYANVGRRQSANMDPGFMHTDEGHTYPGLPTRADIGQGHANIGQDENYIGHGQNLGQVDDSAQMKAENNQDGENLDVVDSKRSRNQDQELSERQDMSEYERRARLERGASIDLHEDFGFVIVQSPGIVVEGDSAPKYEKTSEPTEEEETEDEDDGKMLIGNLNPESPRERKISQEDLERKRKISRENLERNRKISQENPERERKISQENPERKRKISLDNPDRKRKISHENAEILRERKLSQERHRKPSLETSEMRRDGKIVEESGTGCEDKGKEELLDEDNDTNNLVVGIDMEIEGPIRVDSDSGTTTDSDSDSESESNSDDDDDDDEDSTLAPTFIDYTLPRSYLTCDSETLKRIEEADHFRKSTDTDFSVVDEQYDFFNPNPPPQVKPKPKVKPPLLPKPKLPMKPKLKVKFSELARKREIWMVREESGEQREDEDDEAYQKRLSVMSIEKSMMFESDENAEEDDDERNVQKRKVCHHENCKEQNGGNPLLVCDKCDEEVHNEDDSHQRYDVQNNEAMLERNESTRSLPPVINSDDEESEEEEEEGEEVEEEEEQQPEEGEGEKSNLKLKRKKVLKGRRYVTIDGSSSSQSAAADKISDALHKRSSSMPAPCAPNDSDKDAQEALSGLNDIIDTYGSNQTITSGETTGSGDTNDSDLANQSARSAGSGGRFTPEGFGHWVEKNVQDKSSGAGKDEADGKGGSVSKKKGRRPGKTKQSSGANLDICTFFFDILKSSTSSSCSNADLYEVVKAKVGYKLSDALLTALSKRGLSLEEVDVFLSSSHTALPLHTAETGMFAGMELHVRAKTEEEPRLGRIPSSGNIAIKAKATTPKEKKAEAKLAGSQRSNKKLQLTIAPGENDSQGGTASGAGGDISPHGTLTPGDTQRGKAQKGSDKGRLATLFGGLSTKSKLDQLTEVLNQYSLCLPGKDDLSIHEKQYDDDIFQLVSHWSDLIPNHKKDMVPKKQRDQQEAIWELLTTEVIFIKRLSLILNLFRSCILDLQCKHQLLCEIATEQVFGNIRSIYDVNAEFWQCCLLPVYQHARNNQCFLNPSMLKEGFANGFDKLVRPYTKYVIEQVEMATYIKQMEKENELFKTFLLWAETHSEAQVNRLRLVDLIVTPMQQLTRYGILLGAILKNTTDEGQKNDIEGMLNGVVNPAVVTVNAVLQQRAMQQRYMELVDNVEGYQVDCLNEECNKLAAEYCRFDLECPIPGVSQQVKRQLLMEGALKLKDTSVPKGNDCYCTLFTDMFMVTKSMRNGKRSKIIKPPMRLDKIVVSLLRDQSSFMLIYLNEYNIASAVYTFQGDWAKMFHERIKTGQLKYQQLREQHKEKQMQQMLMSQQELYHGLPHHRSQRPLSMGSDFNNMPYSTDGYVDHYSEEMGSGMFAQPSSASAAAAAGGQSASFLTPQSQQLQEGGDGYLKSSSSDQSLARSVSHDPMRPAFNNYSSSLHRGLVPSASFDEAGINEQRRNRRPKSMTFGENPLGSRSPRPSLTIAAESEYPASSPCGAQSAGVHGDFPFFDDTIPPSSSSSSSNKSPVLLNKHNEHQQRHPPSRLRPEVPGAPTSSKGRYLEKDEVLQQKIKQHRKKTEKRFLTADCSQDLKREPDASIHKRLSWNLGTGGGDTEEQHLQGAGIGSSASSGFGNSGTHLNRSILLGGGKLKTFSNDSLKSMPSSSGVSSTGSLQGPDTEIMEEFENDRGELVQADSQSQHSSSQLSEVTLSEQTQILSESTSMTESSTDDPVLSLAQSTLEDNRRESFPSSSSSPLPSLDTLPLPGSNTFPEIPVSGELTPDEQRVGKSKSLSDIANLSLVNRGECLDGIGSVDVVVGNGQDGQKQMTHGEVLKVKKKLWLNSTLEASDV